MDNAHLLHTKQLRAQRKKENVPTTVPPPLAAKHNESEDAVVYYLLDGNIDNGPKIYQYAGSRRHWMMLDHEILQFPSPTPITERGQGRCWWTGYGSWQDARSTCRSQYQASAEGSEQHCLRRRPRTISSKPLPPLPFDFEWIEVQPLEWDWDWDVVLLDFECEYEEFVIIPEEDEEQEEEFIVVQHTPSPPPYHLPNDDAHSRSSLIPSYYFGVHLPLPPSLPSTKTGKGSKASWKKWRRRWRKEHK